MSSRHMAASDGHPNQSSKIPVSPIAMNGKSWHPWLFDVKDGQVNFYPKASSGPP